MVLDCVGDVKMEAFGNLSEGCFRGWNKST